MNDKFKYKPSKEEQKLWAECMSDCFWYRSLPSACFAGTGVFVAIKLGKINPSKYGGPLPKMLLAGGLAYGLGYVSYIMGEECDNKFLEKLPNSKMTETIKINRANKERSLWLECTREAFWYRALPGLCLSSVLLSYLTRSTKARFPVLLLGGTISFLFGFYSYINLERKCHKKFENYLKQNPNSELSLKVMKIRATYLKNKDNEDGKETDSVENDDSFESDIYDKSVGYILPNNAVADNRIRDKIDKD